MPVTRRPLPRVRPLVVVLALLLTATACGSHADKGFGKGAEYVALGDSYTSGPGMDPVADNSCRRSKENYPSRVAKALKIKSFADRSCGGARLGNLAQPQMVRVAQINAPQLDAVGKETKLVTIGMGLNDQAIATSLLLICVSPEHAEPSSFCDQYLSRPQSSIDAQLQQVAKDLAAALQTIHKKAPDAKIVLVGYPRVVPDSGTCGSPGQSDARFPAPEAAFVRLRETLKYVNQLWSDTAKQAGVSYVDMYTPSEGHDICSDDPWIAPYVGIPSEAIGLHPLPPYTKAVAARIADLVGTV